jgi:hypothetical protein
MPDKEMREWLREDSGLSGLKSARTFIVGSNEEYWTIYESVIQQCLVSEEG